MREGTHLGMETLSKRDARGFTIVELVIVIAVIAILAAVAIVGYGSWRQQTIEQQLKSDLQGAATAMEGARNFGTGYPSTIPSTFTATTGTTISLERVASDSFCIEASAASLSEVFYIEKSGGVQEGVCPIPPSLILQTITNSDCPTTRTRALDARDERTYWVQKLTDGKCWMLTNLAYAGGGTDTYGDTKTLVNGTSGTTYTVSTYYINTSSNNYTTDPTDPSTSTTGAGQYGYLYNWCAAMGGQATAACANATTPAVNTTISICPAGWRLPIGASGGEFAALNTAVNGGATNTDSGLLTNWLAQRGGYWGGGFLNAGLNGAYWSSNQYAAASGYTLGFNSTAANPAASSSKNIGNSVRCVAN